jgi:hypothetical protein
MHDVGGKSKNGASQLPNGGQVEFASARKILKNRIANVFAQRVASASYQELKTGGQFRLALQLPSKLVWTMNDQQTHRVLSPFHSIGSELHAFAIRRHFGLQFDTRSRHDSHHKTIRNSEHTLMKLVRLASAEAANVCRFSAIALASILDEAKVESSLKSNFDGSGHLVMRTNG